MSTVYHEEYYDSDLEEEEEEESSLNSSSSDLDSEEDGNGDGDEEEEEICSMLDEILNEIAYVIILGKKKYKIILKFPSKNINFYNKNEICDFDIDNEGYPEIDRGGEDFIPPFIKKLSEKETDLKGCTFYINHKNYKFYI